MSEMTSEGVVVSKATLDRMSLEQIADYVDLFKGVIVKVSPTAWFRVTILFDYLVELREKHEALKKENERLKKQRGEE